MTELSLSNVGIDGFRGLRSLELDGLGRVNILVGSNNSGKTSVLEALSIFCQPLNPEEWLHMVRRRDFGQLDETRLQSLRWCFSQSIGIPDSDQLIQATCKFTCQGAFPLRELRVQYSEFSSEPSFEELDRVLHRIQLRTMKRLRLKEQLNGMDENERTLVEMMHGAEIVHYPEWQKISFFERISGKSYPQSEPPKLIIWEEFIPPRLGQFRDNPKLNSETLTPYSYQINRNQVRSLSKQIFQQDWPNVLELLRDFDPDVDGIDVASFHGDRPAIYIKHRKLGIAPLSIFGDAMRRAVLLASTLLSLKDGGILLVDEVEAGIHVNALARVFEWVVRAARTLQVQVFVTTHSLEALDALVSARSTLEKDDIVAFHLNQKEELTQSKRFSSDLLHRLRFERGLDVR